MFRFFDHAFIFVQTRHFLPDTLFTTRIIFFPAQTVNILIFLLILGGKYILVFILEPECGQQSLIWHTSSCRNVINFENAASAVFVTVSVARLPLKERKNFILFW